ncbi:globin domain-containing protein [Ditylenchus destructor]|uniref:Globin domain-containing protein n=1 Tax=Ditylenchus destructor TaxID=166010 RepID=A0AAD4NFT8_9BILA|nr:globin domain-containing protein [Ditylenchus destructor]
MGSSPSRSKGTSSSFGRALTCFRPSQGSDCTKQVAANSNTTGDMARTHREEIQKICRESLELCPCGEPDEQNGLDFYKYFFTNFPDLRVYFKGAEKFTADDVQKSDRFKKQGQRLLLATHLLVKIYDDPMIYHAYIRETMNRHRQFKIDPALWTAFWTVWLGYLQSKNPSTPVSQTVKDAWTELGNEFAVVARQHLKNLGLPN